MILPLTRNVCLDWEHLLQVYKTFVSKNSIVLEIGASSKKRTVELAKFCRSLIGIEYFPSRTPEDFENVKYIVGDWQNLSEYVDLESIDIAISSHVIEHIPHDLTALNGLYAVLKPGGVAIINTPNRRRLIRAIIDFFVGNRKFPHWEHIREYTEGDLVKLINQSRFLRYEIIPLGFGIQGGLFSVILKAYPRD